MQFNEHIPFKHGSEAGETIERGGEVGERERERRKEKGERKRGNGQKNEREIERGEKEKGKLEHFYGSHDI